MAIGYKYQDQWGRGRGILLLLAMYTGSAGGGAYALSYMFNYVEGLFAGLILLGLGKSLFHILFLGRPERFIKAFMRPNSSWISRGIWGLTLYIIFTSIYLSRYIGLGIAIPGGLTLIAGPISFILSLFLIVYDGFLLVACKGIPVWNNSLIAILFPITALISGIAVMIFIAASILKSELFIHIFEEYELTILLLGSFIILTYVYSTIHTDTASRYSVTQLIRGRYSKIFWLSILTAIILPIAANISGRSIIHIPGMVIGIIAILELLGDLLLKYTILNIGVYRPLVQEWSRPSIYDESYRRLK